MDGRRVFFNKHNKASGLYSQSCANCSFSVGSRKTELSDSASSFLTGGRRKFVNTGSFSTPTTNLSTALFQPIPAVDADLQEQDRSCETSQSEVVDDDRDKNRCERKQLRTTFCHRCHCSKNAAQLTHVYPTTRLSKSEDYEAKCECEQLSKISYHKCHCSHKSAQLSQLYPTTRSGRTDASEGKNKNKCECEHQSKIFNHWCHCSTNSAQLAQVYATTRPEFTRLNNQSTESHQTALKNYSMGSLFRNDNTEWSHEHFECHCKKKFLQKAQSCCSLLNTTNHSAQELSYCTRESSCHHFNPFPKDCCSTQGSSTNDAKQGRLDLRSEVNFGDLNCQVSGCTHHDSNDQTSGTRPEMSAQNEDNTNSAPSTHRSGLNRQMSEPTLASYCQRQLRKCKSYGHKTLQPRREVSTPQVESSDDGDDFHSPRSFQDKRSEPCTPTSPRTGHTETTDPYQIFEVQHSPCLILTVRVLQGRNITLGFQDLYDIPDPYINLIMRSSPEGRKSTTVKEDEPNPVWNETFTFFINFTQANVLEISLMESNSYWFDQLVGTVYYDIVNIRDMDKPQTETFVFNEISEVDIEFKLEFDRHPTLRYSLCLSYQEKMFIKKRKEQILEAMRNLLGDEDGPQNVEEVPTIAVIGSGGGFRAMTGYSGVFKALVESGVLSCTMYACGLSGSSWLLSTLYSHPKWPNLDMGEFLDELKNNIDKSLLRFLNASTMYSYVKFMIEKRREGQPVSFTDIFGRMVGETLLADRMETTLTDQREVIKDGAVPMPLYTCVHVKKDVPARSFQEWVEFSPYEIGMPKYGTFMDAELFGSKFFMGKLVKQYKEQPLHFLQGIWGSAFCILFRRLLEENHHMDPTELVREEMGDRLDEGSDESSSDCSEDEFDDCSVDSTDSLDSESCSTQNLQNIARSARDDVTTHVSTPWRIYQILKPQSDDTNIEETSQEVDGVVDTNSSAVCEIDIEENTDLESIENGNDIIVNGNIDTSSSCDADEEDNDDVDEVRDLNCEQKTMVEGSSGTMETREVNREQIMVEGPSGTIENREVNREQTMVEGSNGTMETREVNSEQIMVEGSSGTMETREINSEQIMVEGSSGTMETREVNSEQIMMEGPSGTMGTRYVYSKDTMVEGSNGTMETRQVNSEQTMVEGSNGTMETRQVNSEQTMVEGSNGTIETRQVNSEQIMVEGSNGTMETRQVNSEQTMVEGSNGTMETRQVNSEQIMVEGSNGTMETRQVNSEQTMVEGSNGTIETRQVNSEQIMVEGSNGTIEARQLNSEQIMVEGSNGTMETRQVNSEQTMVEGSNGTMETRQVNSEQTMVEGSNGTMETRQVNSEQTMVEGSNGIMETRQVNSEQTMVECSNGTIETRQVNSEQTMVEGSNGIMETRQVNSEQTMVEGSNGTIETRQVNSEQTMVEGSNGTMETRQVNSEQIMVEGSNGTMETRQVNSEQIMVEGSNGTMETRQVNSEQIMVEGSNGTIETRQVNSEQIMAETYTETQEETLPQQSFSHSGCKDKDSFLGQAETSQSPSTPQSSHELSGESSPTENGINFPSDCKKRVNWGNCPTMEAKDRRKVYKSCVSVRKSKSGSKSFWKQFLKGILESNSWELLSTRRGRAAVIHNFMRGLSLQQSYPLSPFTPVDERVEPGDEFDGIFEMHPTSVKHIYMVDSGLAFNSPYPLILRPQRAVDIILSFDFSARPSDNDPPFKELLLAEKWARLNRLPFPPIDTSVFDKDHLKELYIFRHPTDNSCPIVFHFVLVNHKFKLYKKPDIPRETKEEFEFAEFQLFDDPKSPYSTFNFTYKHNDFERLSQLMEFNTLLHIGDIKEVIKEVIKTKREAPPRLPVQPSDIELLRMKEQQKMQHFISQMEHMNSIHAGSHPSTPFQTPSSHGETHINPFFAQNENKASQNPPNGNSNFNLKRDLRRECFCRNICRQKNRHPANLYKSGRHNPGPNTKKEIVINSNLSSNSPDVGITHSTPSISPEHALQDQQVVPSNGSESSIIQKEDFSESLNDKESMPLSENITPGPEFNNSVVDTSVDTLETATANHSCQETVSDYDAQQNTNKKPLLLQKLKRSTEEFTPCETTDQTCTTSGYRSPGSKTDISWDRTSNSEVNMENLNVNSPKIDIFSINKISNSEMNMASLEISPPEIVNSSIDKTSSASFSSANHSSDNLSLDNTNEMLNAKVKGKKDRIPNPFFAKAYFMRSPHNSASSSKSLCDTEDDTAVSTCEQIGNKTDSSLHQSTDSVHMTETPKLVGHLSSRTSRPSPLIITSNNKEFSTEGLSSSSETSPEIFTLAPETFKADGTPVFGSQEVKMIYESVKNKRKAQSSSSETSPEIFTLAPEAIKADGTPVFGSQEVKMIYESVKNKRKTQSSTNNKEFSTEVLSSSSTETSPEIFALAPEAFKADGTPVFDSQEAKMFYESVKNKRKLFRRQSTVSSLNSISLYEYEPFCGEIYASKQHG